MGDRFAFGRVRILTIELATYGRPGRRGCRGAEVSDRGRRPRRVEPLCGASELGDGVRFDDCTGDVAIEGTSGVGSLSDCVDGGDDVRDGSAAIVVVSVVRAGRLLCGWAARGVSRRGCGRLSREHWAHVGAAGSSCAYFFALSAEEQADVWCLVSEVRADLRAAVRAGRVQCRAQRRGGGGADGRSRARPCDPAVRGRRAGPARRRAMGAAGRRRVLGR